MPEHNAIIGNTVLYGATAGKLFAAGQAGERFAVRNSGADAVVEGCGSNGCEYMTGGTAVILGAVGDNFAAGMTGGMAFVYDPDDVFTLKVNPETVSWQRIDHPHWEAVLKALVEEHVAETKSPLGARLLNDWNREVEQLLAGGAEGDAVAPAAAAHHGGSQARVSEAMTRARMTARVHARRLAAARRHGRAVRPHLAGHQDRAGGQHAGLAGRRRAPRCRRSPPSCCWRRSAACTGRTAPTGRSCCRSAPSSSPASSPSPISACRACRPAARACWPTPTMLWMVPLSLLVGERVGWRAIAGAALGVVGIVVLIDPLRFDWSDRAVVQGHV